MLITKEKLAEYLDKETTLLLKQNGIYKIGRYAWTSDGSASSEYFGHVLWQTEPPLGVEWDYLFNRGSVRHRPTEKEKILMISGEDFEGLMELSRISIGLSIFHKSITIENEIDDSHYFWLHHADSILHLNMASDRIREYFLMTFFNQTENEYKEDKNHGKDRRWYVTPFIKVKNRAEKSEFNKNVVDTLILLSNMSNDIYSYRKQRNKIVHEVSTRLGKKSKELIDMQEKEYDNSNVINSSRVIPSYKEVMKNAKIYNGLRKKELAVSESMIIDWYKLLVQFSSNIFEVEYRLRVSEKKA